MADISKINGYNVKDATCRSNYANLINFSTPSFNTEQTLGTIGGKTVYRKIIRNTSTHTSTYTIDSALKSSNVVDVLMFHGTHKISAGNWIGDIDQYTGSTRGYILGAITSSGVTVQISGFEVVESVIDIIYTKS